MANQEFDKFAKKYDGWFLQNRNVLESEVRLIARALKVPGTVLSVGCGSGLFEMLLKRDHRIEIIDGLEPSEDMAGVARERGMDVKIGTAGDLPYPSESFDTVLFNGSPGNISDLGKAFEEAFRVLKAGGHVVVADVPAESGYGLLYQLAATKTTWKDTALLGVAPSHPCPIELAAAANWRPTAEKVNLLRENGFVDFEYAQTLTRHPRFSDYEPEEPIEGYDRGNYVTIRARKLASS